MHRAAELRSRCKNLFSRARRRGMAQLYRRAGLAGPVPLRRMRSGHSTPLFSAIRRGIKIEIQFHPTEGLDGKGTDIINPNSSATVTQGIDRPMDPLRKIWHPFRW